MALVERKKSHCWNYESESLQNTRMEAICSGLSEEMTYYWFLQKEIKMEYVTSRLISHYTPRCQVSDNTLWYTQNIANKYKVSAYKIFLMSWAKLLGRGQHSPISIELPTGPINSSDIIEIALQSIYFIVQWTILNGTFVIKRAIITALDGTQQRRRKVFYQILSPDHQSAELNELWIRVKENKWVN